MDQLILSFLDIFPDNFYFELQRIDDENVENYENIFIEIAKKYQIPLIASNNVKYIYPYEKQLLHMKNSYLFSSSIIMLIGFIGLSVEI